MNNLEQIREFTQDLFKQAYDPLSYLSAVSINIILREIERLISIENTKSLTEAGY